MLVCTFGIEQIKQTKGEFFSFIIGKTVEKRTLNLNEMKMGNFFQL